MRDPARRLWMGATSLLVVVVAACGGASDDAAGPARLVERVVPARRTVPGASSPLLVLLHGLGSNENDLVPAAAALDPRFAVVSLRAPHPWRDGFAWFGIDRRPDGTLLADGREMRQSVGDLDRWLAAAPSRLDADPRRVYLLGFSQGAMMALGVLRTAPERLAGVVALSGRFDPTLFDGSLDRPAMARVALFIAHGIADERLPVADGRAVRDAFAPLVPDTTYREYAIPHVIGPKELRDVAAWLTARLDRSA